MRTDLASIAGLLALLLAVSSPPLHAGSPASPASDGALRSLVAPERLASAVREANRRIGSHPDGPAAAIESERDVAMREAMWSAWLDRLALRRGLETSEIEALTVAVSIRPRTFIRHHEAPHRAQPAFRVAARAAALLRRESIRRRAAELADAPGAALDALLRSEPASDGFRAAILALVESPAAERGRAAEELRRRVGVSPTAAAALIELYRADPGFERELKRVVVEAGAPMARRALRAAIEQRAEGLAGLARAALARGGLGGLDVAAWVAAGGDVDAVCWALLDDPASGLEAARALARSSGRLVATVRARFGSAGKLARSRMLLALRLRGSDRSRALLEELAGGGLLSRSELEAVTAWLR